MRKTKIVATVGPACKKDSQLRALPDLEKVKDELSKHQPARKKYQRRKNKK